MKRNLVFALTAIALSLSLLACSTSTNEPTATPGPSPTPNKTQTAVSADSTLVAINATVSIQLMITPTPSTITLDDIQSTREAVVQLIWDSSQPTEIPTWAILTKTSLAQAGGSGYTSPTIGVINGVDRDLSLNLIQIGIVPAFFGGMCPQVKAVDQTDLLRVENGEYLINGQESWKLNAGLFSACFAYANPDRPIEESTSLGLLMASVLEKLPYAEYQARAGSLLGADEAYYKGIYALLHGNGLTNWPLKLESE